jgi:hypothetical protein
MNMTNEQPLVVHIVPAGYDLTLCGMQDPPHATSGGFGATCDRCLGNARLLRANNVTPDGRFRRLGD